MAKAEGFRTEKDSLGEKKVPRKAYYGIQTQRAIENFQISGLGVHPLLITATAAVKFASAKANHRLGLLDRKRADAICRAASEVISGGLRREFVVDAFQAGAGTSHNMNANEVIANRAIELLGGRRGDYSLVHPNDHVNMSQSTNDVVPTAIRIAGHQLFKRANRLDRTAREGLHREIKRVLRRHQIRENASAGRRASDPRAGVRLVRRRHESGKRAPERSFTGASGSRAWSDRRWYRHQHTPQIQRHGSS